MKKAKAARKSQRPPRHLVFRASQQVIAGPPVSSAPVRPNTETGPIVADGPAAIAYLCSFIRGPRIRLAEEIGITRSALTSIIRGRRGISSSTLEKLSRAIGMPMDTLHHVLQLIRKQPPAIIEKRKRVVKTAKTTTTVAATKHQP